MKNLRNLNLPADVAGPEAPTIIEVGTFSDSFYYTNPANTAAGSDGYRGTDLKDLFYEFTITETMDIQVINFGASIANGQMPQGDPANYGYLIQANPYKLLGSSIKPTGGTVLIEYKDLPPGTYYAIFEANQTTYTVNISVVIQGILKNGNNNILNLPEGVAGPDKPVIIEVGTFNDSFYYTNPANTANGSDAYRGTTLKDLFYKFTITETMDIEVINFGASIANGQMPQGDPKNYGYLIQTNPYELLASLSKPTGGTVLIEYRDLPPGTYYTIFEANQTSYTVNISVVIQGIVKK